MKVVLLPQAQEDLDAIAEPLFSKVVKRLQALRRYPALGAAMSGPFSGYRSTLVNFYRIIYKQPTQDTILIAYIRHCRRDLS